MITAGKFFNLCKLTWQEYAVGVLQVLFMVLCFKRSVKKYEEKYEVLIAT